MEKNKGVFKKLINVLLDLVISVLTIVLIVTLYQFVQVKVMKNDYVGLFGYSLFTVQTGSMEPTIHVGDAIVTKTEMSYKTGDIITFKSGEDFITHRVVEAYSNTYVTKGDNNNSKDKGTVPLGMIVGKTVKILPRFDIWKKTLLNPVVLAAIAVALFVINLLCGDGKKKGKNIPESLPVNNEFTPQVREEVIPEVKEEVISEAKEETLPEVSKPITENVQEKKESKLKVLYNKVIDKLLDMRAEKRNAEAEKLQEQLEPISDERKNELMQEVVQEEEEEMSLENDLAALRGETTQDTKEEVVNETLEENEVTLENEDVSNEEKVVQEEEQETEVQKKTNDRFSETMVLRKLVLDADGNIVEDAGNTEEEVVREVPQEEVKEEVKEETEENQEVVLEKGTNDTPEVTQSDVTDEMDKTVFLRSIEVDQSDIDFINNPPEEEEEEVKIEVPEEEVPPTKIESEISRIQRKRKFVNTYHKVLCVKEEELNKLFEILLNKRKKESGEDKLKEELLKLYVDARYHNYLDGEFGIDNRKKYVTFTNIVDKRARELAGAKKVKDQKYIEKVLNVNRLIDLLIRIDFTHNEVESASKRCEEVLKMVKPFYGKETMKNVREVVKEVVKTQRFYQNIYRYIFEKLETNQFEIKSDSTNIKNLYHIYLDHNVEFSKMYSDYIIDKTYNEGVIAEDAALVTLKLLSSEIAKDMLHGDFKDKYIVSVTGTILEKEKKFTTISKKLDDIYAKHCIHLLINYEEFKKNTKVIKKYISAGYTFSVFIDELKGKVDIDVCHLAKEICAFEGNSVVNNIPAEFKDKLVSIKFK